MLHKLSRAFLVVAFALFFGAAGGCGTTTQTTEGPRPTVEVVAQDTVADVLKVLDDLYRAAVLKHNAAAGAMDPAAFTAEGMKLRRFQSALLAAWDVEIGWKKSSGAASPVSVLAPLCDSFDDFTTQAIGAGVMTLEQKTKVKPFVDAACAAIVPTPTPRPEG